MHLIAISLCLIHRGLPYLSLNAENIRNKNSYIGWTVELNLFVTVCDKTIEIYYNGRSRSSMGSTEQPSGSLHGLYTL